METRRPAFVLLAVIYLGFVSLGLPDGTLGVAWPPLAADLRLPIGLAGVITIVITLLSAASGFASGRIVASFRTGPVVLVSCVLTGSALLAIAHAGDFGWLLVAAIPLGLGAGAVDAGLNGFVAHHYSGRHMNWLHACWGVGATVGPILMGQALVSGQGWRGGYVMLGTVQLSLALLFLFSLRLWSVVPERAFAATVDGHTRAAPTLSANSFSGWLSPVLFALYVAMEGTTGLWAGSILTVGRGFSVGQSAACVAAFYGAITGGRILAGMVVDRWGNRNVIRGGVIIALVGAGVFIAARTPTLASVALVLLGVGYAPVYPGLMHEVPRRFAPEATQTVIGRQSGAAYLGMAVVPPLLGLVAGWSLEVIPVALLLGIALLLFGIRRLDQITSQPLNPTGS
jgi:MFS family permease